MKPMDAFQEKYCGGGVVALARDARRYRVLREQSALTGQTPLELDEHADGLLDRAWEAATRLATKNR